MVDLNWLVRILQVDNHEDFACETFMLSSEIDILPIKEEMMDPGSIS